MIFVDGLTGMMFEANPDDIHEKVSKVNDQLLTFKDFLKIAEPEYGHFKTNSRRIRAFNSRR